jgi:mono/diheme cytochrome c family protein
MKRITRTAVYVLGGVAGLVMVAYATAYAVSERKLAERFDVALTTVEVPEDETMLAWGSHLVNAVTGCQDCHGPDLAGSVMSDDPMALMAAPNLTSGRGGVGREFTDADWVRAIRHGVRRDGSSLLIMPSYAYAHLSDRDLGAMVAYLKQLPPVDREQPAVRVRPLGRALVGAGLFDNEFVARKTPRRSSYDAVEPGVTLQYGAYLANVSGCISCHGPDLKGGPAGPPDAPPASDISPTALAGWGGEDFIRAMRQGRRPDGSEISDFMPWRVMGRMTDDELGAIWLFLRSAGAN